MPMGVNVAVLNFKTKIWQKKKLTDDGNWESFCNFFFWVTLYMLENEFSLFRCMFYPFRADVFPHPSLAHPIFSFDQMKFGEMLMSSIAVH